MTNEVDYAPRKYLGNGSTTEFKFDWKAIKDNELIVTLENTYTGEQKSCELYTDYTVYISSYGDGKIIFKTAPSNNYYVIIERDVSNKQGTKYSTSTGFQGSQLEKDFDRVSCNIQEIEYKLRQKYHFLDNAQITITYPRFCVNKAGYDFAGNPNFLTYSNNILTAKADFVYTTGSGYTHEVYNDLTLNTSAYSANSYNIFVNYDKFTYSLVLYDNTVYKQKTEPANASVNDIWYNLDFSPSLAYIKTASGWEITELVPLGKIEFKESAADTDVSTISSEDKEYTEEEEPTL